MLKLQRLSQPILFLQGINLKFLWSTWRMDYIRSDKSSKDCVFCEKLLQPDGPENLIVARSSHSYAILNRYPYTSGHLMVVPFEHASSLEELDPDTRSDMMEMIVAGMRVLRGEYQAQGFNVGLNVGEAAGAGIQAHTHMHIVPRWGGDTNFMSTLAGTRVIPEALNESYGRIRRAWEDNKGT